MGNITTYLADQLLAHGLGQSVYPSPTNVYAALFTVLPATGGVGGTEVSAAGYARVSRSVADWNSAANGAITNATDIRFPTTGGTTSVWGACVGLGFYDSLTSAGTNNLLWYGKLSATVTVNMGDDFRIAASTLTISLS